MKCTACVSGMRVIVVSHTRFAWTHAFRRYCLGNFNGLGISRRADVPGV
jgi:hypothetical protein